MKNFWLERASFSPPTWHPIDDASEPIKPLPQLRVLSIALKASIALLLSLCAWEIIARNAIEQSTGTMMHPALGKIYRAGTTLQAGEGFSRTTINRLGMRGEETPAKVKGEFRVLSIGDSFTSGYQVEDAKTYSALVETALQNQTISPTRVVNAGRSGASAAYYLQLADFYNTTFQPDSVVVQLNDTDITSEALDSTKEFYITSEGNQFKLHRNQNFASDDPLSQVFQKKFPQLDFLLRVSILRIGARHLNILLKRGAPPAVDGAAPSEQTPSGLNYDALAEWAVVNLKAKYRNLILVHIPYDTNNLNKPAQPAEAALIKMAEKHRVPIVAMRKDFVAYYRVTRQPASGFNNTIPGTGHINEIGHELIARRLAPMLQAMKANP